MHQSRSRCRERCLLKEFVRFHDHALPSIRVSLPDIDDDWSRKPRCTSYAKDCSRPFGNVGVENQNIETLIHLISG